MTEQQALEQDKRILEWGQCEAEYRELSAHPAWKRLTEDMRKQITKLRVTQTELLQRDQVEEAKKVAWEIAAVGRIMRFPEDAARAARARLESENIKARRSGQKNKE